MDAFIIFLLCCVGLLISVAVVIAIIQGARLFWYFLRSKTDDFCEKHDINTW